MFLKPCFFLLWNALLVAVLLQCGCGGDKKGPPKEGQMPKRDAIREAEFAAEREKRLLALAPVEKKVMAGLKNWENAESGEHGEVAVLLFGGNKRTLTEALMSPDASKLALVFWQNKRLHYQILDFASGKKISCFTGSEDGQIKHAFSPNSALLAAGGFDWKIAIWDVNEGKTKKTISQQGPVWHLVFAPDGKHVLASVEGTLRMFEIDTGKEVTKIGDGMLNAAHPAISPSGNLISATFTFENNQVGLWEAATGAKIKTLPQKIGQVEGCVFSPDGWHLVLRAVPNSDRVLIKWNLETDELTTLAKGSILSDPVFSPDGKSLGFLDFAEGKFELVLVDLTTGKEVHRVPGVLRPTFSPGGLLLMSLDNNRLRVWSLAELLAPAGKKEKLKSD